MLSSSVSVVAFGIDAALLELGADLGLDFLEFVDVCVEIVTLVLEIGDVQAAAAQELAQLLHAGAVDLVEVEQLLDLGERKAQALAAQDPRQPRAVAAAVEPSQALAARLDQALVLVEADGARRDRELAGELGDAIDAQVVARGWGFGRGGGGWGDGGHNGSFIVDVYVNVNAGLRK